MIATLARGLVALVFGAAQLGVWTDPLGPNRVVPHTAREALARSGAAAALDGPMFDIEGEGYRTARVARLRYRHLEARARQDHDGGRATDHRGITVSVVDGRAVVRDGDAIAPGATVALQLYPTLVRRGRVEASAAVNRETTWRAALAVLHDGRLALVVGRASMRRFAEQLVQLGAVDAGYTDGGGSARLARHNGAWWGAREDRRVASWIVVRSE